MFLQTLPVRRFTVIEFERMENAGLLSLTEAITLFDGFLYKQAGRELHRFSVDEYERLIALGILRADERLELIRGEIIEMSPTGALHTSKTDRINREFSRIADDSFIVRVQSPIRLTTSEPEPEISVLRVRDDFYESSHPTAADVLLLVEVSDSTLIDDLTRKIPLYAQENIPEVWIVDIEHARILQYSQPSNKLYHHIQRWAGEAQITSVSIPSLTVSVARLFETARH